MNKVVLSERMRRLADMLRSEGETLSCVADVGCDHALVSAYLVEQGIAEKVLAMDVRTGPLEIARRNLHKFGLEKSVEVRMSDGFQALSTGEAQWAVLAGLGGALMNRLLAEGKSHLESGIGLVLQPQSEVGSVRAFLSEVGYGILDEDFLQEDGKFYTIIKAKKNAGLGVSGCEREYGPVLLARRHPVLRVFLTEQERKLSAILEQLKAQGSQRSRTRQQELSEQLSLIAEALSRYEEE